MGSLPTGTVTFLFTDIEGSTALLQRLGDRRYAEVLAEHQRLLREAFAEGHGQVVDTQGDAFLVAFPRARDALAAAVAAQRALTKHAWPDGTSLRLRMGLHTGEPVAGSGDYVGLDVHRAARICAAGHGGQILLSRTVGDLTAADLPSGVSLRDLGSHRLKDLREPEHLFQVVHPDLPSDFPTLKSLDARPNNLPRELTSFIGREREIDEIKRLLSNTALLTLTGAGGSGKTRLALQVAAGMLDEFRDGAWLVELASLSDPAFVVQAVASALAVPEQPGRALTDTLVDALRGKSLLLVLDNCEHLLAACADLVGVLLRNCAAVRVLSTSRGPLGLRGEVAWHVPPLSLPDLRHAPTLEELTRYEAVRLFVERAALSKPGFTIAESNAAAIAKICEQLDGLPLAIELAAARVKVLTVEQIVARLDDRFRILTRGGRDVLPRHQTLRAAMDWSYDLLSESERALLRRLSVFAGGWTLEAAEGVCSDGVLPRAAILDVLTSLVEKSLVVVQTHGDEARYQLLETVRQYGQDRLAESAEAAGVRTRHRDWYLGLAERAEPELGRADQELWLERLANEHDNLRAALEWSRTEPGGVEVELRLAGALQWFWGLREHWTEGRGWLETALTRSRNAPSVSLAKVYRGAAYLAWHQGDHEQATVLAEKGLALSRGLGDKEGSALLLRWQGLAAAGLGDLERANALLEASLALDRELGDKALISMELGNLAGVARSRGDDERAATLLAEAVTLSKEAGIKWTIAVNLAGQGSLSVAQGNYAQAEALFKESLTLCRDTLKRFVAMSCLSGLHRVAYAQGANDRAARLYSAAHAARESLGHRLSAGGQLVKERHMALLLGALGDAAFEAAWAEGQAMRLEEAIEYALDAGRCPPVRHRNERAGTGEAR